MKTRREHEALKRDRVNAYGWKLVQIIINITNGINGIIFILRGVGAETVPALTRRVDDVTFHQGSDLIQKYFFESSRKFHHYLQREPIWQLHLKKGFMMTINMEVSGIIISEDFEELPTDWTAEL
jgi:hypothetical protein